MMQYMDVFRKIVAVVAAVALAFCIVGLGFAACIVPPVTHGLSSVFALDDVSPFDRNQLVKVADATRDYSFGSHDELAMYRTIYEIDAAFQASIEDAGGTLPTGFPALNAVHDTGNAAQYRQAFAYASELYCYSPDTMSHLDDCHDIAARAYAALIAAAIVAVAGLAFTGFTGRGKRLGKVLVASGAVVLLAFVALGVWAVIDFNGLFTMFHQVFFAQQGNWTFPYDSLLICSLPQAFWAGMAVVWLVTSVLLSSMCIIIGRKVGR